MNDNMKEIDKINKRILKFEYGFGFKGGIIKRTYNLHEIPNIKNICKEWDVLPIIYVRQFTNSLDKDNCEIYEGDIIKYYNGFRIAVFTPGDGLKLEIIYEDYDGGVRQTHENWTYNIIKSSKIVGNIYEGYHVLNRSKHLDKEYDINR